MGVTTATMLALGAVGLAAAGSVAGGIDADKQASFESADQRQQGAREKQIAEDQEEDFRRQQSRVAAASRAELESLAGQVLVAINGCSSQAGLRMIGT